MLQFGVYPEEWQGVVRDQKSRAKKLVERAVAGGQVLSPSVYCPSVSLQHVLRTVR